jgi:hypothetical protein
LCSSFLASQRCLDSDCRSKEDGGRNVEADLLDQASEMVLANALPLHSSLPLCVNAVRAVRFVVDRKAETGIEGGVGSAVRKIRLESSDLLI